MSARPTTDQLIAAWTTETVGSGAADYLPEVMAVVNRTSQNRFARWLPTAWTVAPARAPKLRTGIVFVAMLALLVALAVGTLVAGGLRRPAFTLQSVVPLPGSVDTIYSSASRLGRLGHDRARGRADRPRDRHDIDARAARLELRAHRRPRA